MEYNGAIKMNAVDPHRRYKKFPKYCIVTEKTAKWKLCMLFCVKNVCVCVCVYTYTKELGK